jgi:hypothetical protein
MIEIMNRGKIATGATLASEWQALGNNGLFVDVDTTAAGFTKTPTYITALHGFGAHWRTSGGSSVYSATPKTFRVYVRFVGAGPLTPEMAQQHGWHIQWVGIES